MSHRTRILRFLRHWHARIGVLAALFFILLASSGIALNHTESLKLDSCQVSAAWLMHWYGLRAAVPSQEGYLFEHGYFAWGGQRCVMDGKLLPQCSGQPVGAVEADGLRYIATPSALYIYQPDGTLVDKLEGSALPATPLRRIGKAGNTLLVESTDGAFLSADGIDWHPAGSGAGSWAEPRPLPASTLRQAETLLAPNLPLERVLLDIHSGRIFGAHGPLAMDLAALVLLALSVSGFWIYWRSFRRKASHHE